MWMVGLMAVVMAVGGIAVDLWRALSAHRELASLVDAAAVAAGSGIDEEIWRLEGELVLDPAVVSDQVSAAIAAQSPAASVTVSVETSPDGAEATVVGASSVELTLLGLLVDGDLDLSARATASPAISP